MEAIPQTSIVSSTIAATLGFIFLLVFYGLRPAEERRDLMLIAVGAYLLKVALVPVYFNLLVHEDLGGFAYYDSRDYHYHGLTIADEFRYGLPHDSFGWRANDPGYFVVCGLLYLVFGPDVLVPRIFNVLMHTLMLLYVYRSAALFFDTKIAKTAVRLTAFLPYPILLTINHRKESVVILLSMMCFYHAAILLRGSKGRLLSSLLLAAAVLANSYFRSGFVMPFFAVLFISFMISQRSAAESVVLVSLTVLALVGMQLLVPEDSTLSLARNTDRLQGKFETSAALAQAGGLVSLARITSPFDIWKLPISTFLMLVLPFPPYLGNYLPVLLLSWFQLASIYFLPHLMQGIAKTLSGPDWRLRVPVLVFPTVFVVLLGVIQLGVIRYRETIFPAVLIITAVGVHTRKNTMLHALTYVGFALLAVVVYVGRGI